LIPINSTAQISTFIISNFSFSEYIIVLQPLLLYVLGMALYAWFIFKFYRLMSRQDIIKLNHDKYSKGLKGIVQKIARSVSYVFQNLILIPIFIFIWFVVLTTFLALLSKTSSLDSIITISIATVAVIRIAAYYNENLSQDLAKIIPFTILGVFLVDSTFFSISVAIETVQQFPALWKQTAYYIVFVVLLEFVLLVAEKIFRIFFPKKEGAKNSKKDD